MRWVDWAGWWKSARVHFLELSAGKKHFLVLPYSVLLPRNLRWPYYSPVQRWETEAQKREGLAQRHTAASYLRLSLDLLCLVCVRKQPLRLAGVWYMLGE